MVQVTRGRPRSIGNVTNRCTLGKVAEKHRYQVGPTRDAFTSLICLFFGYDLIEKLPVYLMVNPAKQRYFTHEGFLGFVKT